MKEQLISFETAKLAYEKGYNREVVGISFTSTRRNYYNEKGELNGDCTDFIKDVIKYGREKAKIKHVLYPATSQSLLQKWLREEHEIHININTFYFEDLEKYGYEVEDIIHKDGWVVMSNTAGTYEEALEKGLQQALKLI